MEKVKNDKKPMNSRGAALLQKLIDDHKFISNHLRNGGELTDLTDKYTFLDPLSFYKPK